MPSITIELTDEEYQTAQALPKSEQRRALLLADNQILSRVWVEVHGKPGKD